MQTITIPKWIIERNGIMNNIKSIHNVLSQMDKKTRIIFYLLLVLIISPIDFAPGPIDDIFYIIGEVALYTWNASLTN